MESKLGTDQGKNCGPKIPARELGAIRPQAERHRGIALRAGMISFREQLVRLPEKGDALGNIPVVDI